MLGAKSKASNFGRGDRPWIELTAYQIRFTSEVPKIVLGPVIPTHVAYCIGLLAWTLGGREDLGTLAYYREAARDFSDDGLTMCGAFGRRLRGATLQVDQLEHIVERLRVDPSSRRTFAAIIDAADNINERIEYPCAAGIQLFVRNGALSFLTVMRAQQALTVLPYDVFLFSTIQHFLASELSLDVGEYVHFSGTYHIYSNEVEKAKQTIDKGVQTLALPPLPRGRGYAVRDELIQIEAEIREAAEAGDSDRLKSIATSSCEFEFNTVAKGILLEHAHARPGR
ncbi:thymidylate synthase [Microbacterium sp. ASV81]|uniref:thymidylate synthase n=1 Tax=Microbacterium capsulatum TaxID=3041921 RepID=A0ABU0XGN2_9MICO|nr:thymidylate synthase [Microbacterium sp. ASV81]MDQ4213723.1 thymidylate synthase [Microbacterium sp. ASV81]